MIVTFAGKSYDCAKAVREGGNAVLHLTGGGAVEFVGVRDDAWEKFHLDGGAWEIVTPAPSNEERLDALEAAMLAVMMGGMSGV